MRRALTVAALAWLALGASAAQATIYPGKGATSGYYGEPRVTKAPGPVQTAQGPKYVNTWWFDWTTTRAVSTGDARVTNHRVCAFVSVDGGSYGQLPGDRLDGCYSLPNENGTAGTDSGGFPVWRGQRSFAVYVDAGHTYTMWARQYYDYAGSDVNYRDEYPFNGYQDGALTRTFIDVAKPTSSIVIEHGAAATTKNVVDLSIGYADNSGVRWADQGATWLCAYNDRQCEPGSTLPSGQSAWISQPCTNYNPEPSAYTCQLDLTGVPDGTFTKCSRVGDDAIPDNGNAADQFVRPGAPSQLVDASYANLSDVACDSITLDRSEPTLNPVATPSPAQVGTQVSFQANASDANLDRVEWSFGDGATATGQSVTHTYSTTGDKAVTATAYDTGGGSRSKSFTITITSGVPAPGIAIAPQPSLDFGSIPAGGESFDKAVTVTNTGTLPLQFTDAVSFGGTNATMVVRESLFSGTCVTPGSLDAGESCTINVRFRPPSDATTGSKSATLSIPTNVPGSPQSESLTAQVTASAAQLAVQETSLAFGSMPQGASTEQSLVIKNVGGQTATGIGFAFPADYTKDAGASSCGSSLNARVWCAVVVKFTPSAQGARNGNLTISSTNGGGATIALTGSGAPPAPLADFSANYSYMQFFDGVIGAESATQQHVSVSNVGSPGQDLNISSIAITGADADQFVWKPTTGYFSTGACPAPGRVPRASDGDPVNGCAVVVAFAPTSPGDKEASLVISHNATGSPQTIPLYGRGVPELSPASLGFGIALAGSPGDARYVTVTNNGRSSIGIGGLSFAGAAADDFARPAGAAGGTCAASLAAGASCTIGVVFTPLTAGQRTATLGISFSGGGYTTVPLAGVGTTDLMGAGAGLSLTPRTAAFGEHELGSTGSQTLFVANNGTEPLTLSEIALGGTDAADFTRAEDGTCTSSTVLAGGEACTIELRFAPSAAGQRTATLTVAGAAESVTAELEGVGIAVPGGGTPEPGGTVPPPGPGPAPAAYTDVAGGTVGGPLSGKAIARETGSRKIRTVKLAGASVLVPARLRLARRHASIALPLGLTVARPGRFDAVLLRGRKKVAAGGVTFARTGRYGFRLRLAAKRTRPGGYRLRLQYRTTTAGRPSTKTVALTVVRR